MKFMSIIKGQFTITTLKFAIISATPIITEYISQKTNPVGILQCGSTLLASHLNIHKYFIDFIPSSLKKLTITTLDIITITVIPVTVDYVCQKIDPTLILQGVSLILAGKHIFKGSQYSFHSQEGSLLVSSGYAFTYYGMYKGGKMALDHISKEYDWDINKDYNSVLSALLVIGVATILPCFSSKSIDQYITLIDCNIINPISETLSMQNQNSLNLADMVSDTSFMGITDSQNEFNQ